MEWDLTLFDFREEGILILSGGLTAHNLRDRGSFSPDSARPIHKEFDEAIHKAIEIESVCPFPLIPTFELANGFGRLKIVRKPWLNSRGIMASVLRTPGRTILSHCMLLLAPAKGAKWRRLWSCMGYLHLHLVYNIFTYHINCCKVTGRGFWWWLCAESARWRCAQW